MKGDFEHRRSPADHGGNDFAAARDCQFPKIAMLAHRRFELPRGADCPVVNGHDDIAFLKIDHRRPRTVLDVADDDALAHAMEG